MRKAVLFSGMLVIVIMALAFCSPESGADEARSINVSLDSGAIGTGDTLTISYTMQRDYPAGQLYIRDRNTNDQLYYLACPGAAGTHSVTWSCNAPEGSYYVIIFGVVNDSYQDANACGFTVDNSPPVTAASAPGSSGWRRNTITLTARDTFSGVAEMFYSLDNATWQQCSSPDTGRVAIPGGVQTLYFYAVDRAGNRETVRSVTYNVDDQPPVTAVELTGIAGTDGWYTSDVQVTLAANDSASGVAGTYYLLDGVEYTYSGPFTLGAGSYWLTYWSRDNAGNVESPHDLDICVDTAAPVTTTSPPGNTGRYINNIVTLTAAGISGIRELYYSFDGNDWLSCSSSDPGVGYVIVPEGTHTLYYRAQGNNGLMEAPGYATFMVDRRRPTITAALSGRQGDNGWYNSSVQATLTASDGESGVASIGYDLDGSPQNYDGPFTIDDGAHSLTFRAADNAGNVNTSAAYDIKVDITPPEITCTLSGIYSQGRYVSDVQATLIFSDNLAGVSHTEYSTDGTDWKSYAGPFIVKTGDPVTIYYRCTDNAGNTAVGSQIVSFAPANGDAPGNDPPGYGSSTPAPTSAPALSPSPSPASSLKPTATPTPTPLPTPSATPSAAPVQEWTNPSCLLLLLLIMALIAAVLIYRAYLRSKNKGRKRL